MITVYLVWNRKLSQVYAYGSLADAFIFLTRLGHADLYRVEIEPTLAGIVSLLNGEADFVLIKRVPENDHGN